MDALPPALLGRSHPTAVLRARLAAAVAGRGGLVLVTGEPGIGKTSLLTHVADEARAGGALVLTGWCSNVDRAPGYWPWVQVLRGLRRGVGAGEWAGLAAAGGPRLAALLGEAPAADAAAEPFALSDAVTSVLVEAAQRRPVAVILDDLQWADPASLRLLRFAMRESWLQPLLLVGAYRDVEVAEQHAPGALFAPLTEKATSVTLTGLGRDEVGRLIARTAGREPAADLVDTVLGRTGGNPFLVEQVARLWASVGSATAMAAPISDAVRARLDLLAAPVAELLTAAAVLGRRFHHRVLAAAAGQPVDAVDALLEDAVAARLVLVEGDGRFGFTHDLVREALYDGLPADRRQRAHAAAVRALDRPGAADRSRAAELAHHAHLAGAALDRDRRVALLLAAGREAGTWLAAEEAVGHYRRALALLTGHDPRRHAIVSLDLARELHRLGERDAARRIFREVAAAARRAPDPDVLARAALVLHGLGDDDALTAALLAEAHGRPAGGPAPDSVDDLAESLTRRVATAARRGDDDEALAFSLWARLDALRGPGAAGERLALIDELAAVGHRRGDRELEYFAASLRWVAHLERGDPAYLDHFRAFVALADREALARYANAAYIDRCVVSAHTGRFAEAEAHLGRALALTEARENLDVQYVDEHLRWTLWLLQGRFDALDGLHRSLAGTGHPHPDLLAAITAVERGDPRPGLRYLAEPAALPRAVQPLRLRLLAHTAAAAGDADLCRAATEALTPVRGQWLVSLYGADISGPVDLWLGLVHAAAGRWPVAAEALAAARESADRLQAAPWSVLARAHLARLLADRGDPAAAGAAAEARAAAAALGMAHVVALLAAPAAAPAGAEFRRSGSTWTLAFAGRTVRIGDAKGLRDLHALLGQPGVDVPAVRLLSPEGGDTVVAARGLGGDPVLDETAKAQYKRRLGDLDEQIERALGRGDDGRAARLDAERQALLRQLRDAVGLGGRSRRLGDEAERARKAVTARIHDVLRKLDERHPELAAHLRAAVTTGATCRYLPESEVRWTR
ncbi:hypothetical protein GCM10010123_28330 [Pilimelia anulata]|uniref:Orc1-like AAA ATPase domain-containing protein n=1 Tax=Pilimelia anulata TaxID=53371 RepID=A0A8J3B697_9ACTN|nr:AAA family ATPase [Pilimelia anulata]GGJ96670.1 hypothetical protein GCM10010123_28330 [Pilimelia anulata]